jgi:hypothetical protein
MLSVLGSANRNEYGDYFSKEARPEAFADTGALNEMLEPAISSSSTAWNHPRRRPPSTGQGEKAVRTDGPYLVVRELPATEAGTPRRPPTKSQNAKP